MISGSGAVAQIGSGTTILTADNPYTGGTTINAGTLAVGDFAHPSAALSGGGPIAVGAGGTLGGYGSVTGAVTNGGVIAPGSATPGFSGSPTGTFTIIGNLLNQGAIQLASGESIGNVLEVRGNYMSAGGSMAINTFLGGDGSPSDRLVINGGAATGSTSVHVTNVGGPGALTTANGILVVDAISGATTSPGAFSLSNPELRAGAFDYRLFQGGVSGSPNDWFLRSTLVSPPIPPVPPVPPPPLSPIIGPELATYGVVQPLARQLGLSILGTLDDRVGDTYEPDGCAVAPALPRLVRSICRPRSQRGADQEAGPAPCPLFSPSVWGRFFGQTIHNHYQAFADPSASGNLGGFQGGDRSSARISDRRPVRARRPLWRLWRRARRRERPRHQSGGDRLRPHPHRIDEPQRLVGGRLLDAYRARRLVSRRRAARDLVLRLGQHPVREA